MKHIRKILVVLVVILATATANAQFRYGPMVGITHTTLNFKQDLAPVHKTFSGQAGLQAEMMFPGIGFGIDLGLIYNAAGAKVNFGAKPMWATEGLGNERMLLHELNIPFHLRFKYTRLNGLEDFLAPFVYAGPEFNILLGHSKCSAMDYSGGDLSLGFGGGVELWKRWQVSVQYTRGMTYITKAKILSDYSAKGNQWALRVTYFLK